ncbi:hypothetical protein B0I31_103301 [Saccharothrix carnea]|uniref:Uncharacterized protein n=1 Tax=Saccharothrix carnea TaxID=1280637 RepID=A0A2P8IDN0_SACCR|nr:hypothetical protein B0I31_103301 [Saccharothrix carnea]
MPNLFQVVHLITMGQMEHLSVGVKHCSGGLRDKHNTLARWREFRKRGL